MPGLEDKESFWKDQDINPTQCGSCGGKNIALVGDFFTCQGCGHQWPKREEPKPKAPTQDEVLDILVRHFLAPNEALLVEEHEVLIKWSNRKML